jgi:hypothetical protein
MHVNYCLSFFHGLSQSWIQNCCVLTGCVVVYTSAATEHGAWRAEYAVGHATLDGVVGVKKGRVVLVHDMKLYGVVEVRLHSFSTPVALYPVGKTPRTHRLGPRTGPDGLEKRKIFYPCWELKLDYSDIQHVAQSLYTVLRPGIEPRTWRITPRGLTLHPSGRSEEADVSKWLMKVKWKSSGRNIGQVVLQVQSW